MNTLQTQILHLFVTGVQLSSSQILASLPDTTYSLISIKRAASYLVQEGMLATVGAGRSLKYQLTTKGIILKPFDVDTYLSMSEVNRGTSKSLNFSIFTDLQIDAFSPEEMQTMNSANEKFQKNKKESSSTIHKKELERFIIELSWKSSQIEGNTYTLLDTERLIREGIKSNKNTESEARMILNHKQAFDYIWNNKEYFRDISIKKIEEVHYLLTEDLGIQRNIRNFPVGVTGTIYKPLDNQLQIREALEKLVLAINSIENIYQKALCTILCISYIQPFEDANKRTSRLLGNALLLVYGLAPLSYRNVNEVEYRAASLVFYEQNSIEAFKQIFIEQYVFSCNTYNLG
jgi:prophage maintenance system killer protein